MNDMHGNAFIAGCLAVALLMGCDGGGGGSSGGGGASPGSAAPRFMAGDTQPGTAAAQRQDQREVNDDGLLKEDGDGDADSTTTNELCISNGRRAPTAAQDFCFSRGPDEQKTGEVRGTEILVEGTNMFVNRFSGLIDYPNLQITVELGQEKDLDQMMIRKADTRFEGYFVSPDEVILNDESFSRL